jgi:uncharacterized membrane protein
LAAATANQSEEPMIYLLALLIGVVAGLRALTPLAAVSWAAALGGLPLHGTWLAFLGFWLTPWIVTVLAAAELVADQLPSTPSRKTAGPFAVRIVIGALCGAAIGTAGGSWFGGLVAGVIGAVIGTLGGAAVRAWLAGIFDRDRPAAVIEDVVAIAAAILIVLAA